MNYDFKATQYEASPNQLDGHELNLVKSGMDDREKILYNLQLVFLVDTSGSMREADQDPLGQGTQGLLGNYWCRYDNTVKVIKLMINEIFKFDKDGKLPLYFFNNDVKKEIVSSPDEVIMKCRRNLPTDGSTNLYTALEHAFSEINDIDNILFVVFTDGCPNKGQEITIPKLIHDKVVKRDPTGDRLNMLFVRMGDDPGAIEFLRDLDDDPSIGGWVDTKSDNACFALGPKLLLLNAIFEELEKLPVWSLELQKYP